MHWIILFISGLVHPCEPEAGRLAAAIVRVQPRAAWYAQELACAIYQEAGARDLDPTILAAIAWMESWYDDRAQGGDRERGIWQVYPPAARYLGWRGTDRQIQEESRDIPTGTRMAATILAVFVQWCRRRHRDHRLPSDAYAHYNSGWRWPRPGYRWRLWQRTKELRVAVGRPPITETERAWLNR